ncbi:MAG: hypothetical protein LBD29_06760 [Treponema sp.]|nr:hypothetical protein [Treponema sp.]
MKLKGSLLDKNRFCETSDGPNIAALFEVRHTLPVISKPVFLDLFSLSRYNQTYSELAVLSRSPGFH